jgi:branched-chain amino acid transport system ATP-binding protein
MTMTDLVVTNKVTKKFASLTAVSQVDFRIHEGEAAGVIGPNGSGKTTLFNLLSGYFMPTAGTIRFLGGDITHTSSHQRVGMGMARTFQLVSVFDSLSTWENLVLSTSGRNGSGPSRLRFFFGRVRCRKTLQNCEAALDMVGLLQDATRRTSELSYGDKRMLEIAIALSLKPKVLLLDEPFAGLSDHEIGQVVNLIERIKGSLTVVIIEHKISKITQLIERLWVMNDGRLICEGSPAEVLSNLQVRECYWGKEGAF